MDLPNDSIGISDLLDYRDCPRRMSYGMRRHSGVGVQSDDRTPEAGSYATEYGSAIHEVIRCVEDGFTDDGAIQQAWDKHGRWLEPADLDQLRTDLEVYRSRDFPNTRIVANEDEFRIPLFTHEGRQVYFRFKLDRLYERLDEPGTFIHIDYKSSRSPRSREEVNGNLQLWAYNLGIHEFFPEVDRLLQFYDQLRYGQIPTRKSDAQREQIREFLIRQATTILNDEDRRDDGLLVPKKNDWCAWCPILESCPVVLELSDFAQTQIAALVPRRPKLKKDGSPGKRMEDVPLVVDKSEDYAGVFREAKQAEAILKRFTTSVSSFLKALPDDRRAELGFELQTRKTVVFNEQALRALHERLGPEFYNVVALSKTALEEYLEGDPSLLAWALDQGLEVQTQPVLKQKT